MKKIFLSLALISCTFITYSQEVSESLAVRMANHYFQKIDLESKNAIDSSDSLYRVHQLSTPEWISPNGKANMWLIPVEDGWVILSGSIKATPILAYIQSFEKPVYDSMPPAAQELIDSYEDYLVYIREHDSQYEIDSRWLGAQNNMEAESDINRDNIDFIGDTLLTKWGQSGGGSCATNKIYNKFCPSVSNPVICDKAHAGCVAVAIAQIMRYWNWPYAAQVPQTIGGNDTILTFYDWTKMPIKIDNSTEMEKVDMIAGFLRDCGYKLDMDYGANGSSADDDAAVETLIAFGYDENSIDLRSKWLTPGWTNMLRTNIDNGQPVYYAGYKTILGTGGHAFVVDGYQTGDYPIYHINFGWNGWANGWYNIDDAYVNDTIHYEHYQSAIFGIRPDSRFCGDKTITTVESPKFCIAQSGIVTLDGVQISNISDGRVYSAEGIVLTNGTYISSECNVVFDIKPVPCTSSPQRRALTPWRDSSYTMSNTPSTTKILRGNQILILRDGRTFSITGQEIK